MHLSDPSSVCQYMIKYNIFLFYLFNFSMHDWKVRLMASGIRIPPISMDWIPADLYNCPGLSGRLEGIPLLPNQLELYSLHVSKNVILKTRIHKVFYLNFKTVNKMSRSIVWMCTFELDIFKCFPEYPWNYVSQTHCFVYKLKRESHRLIFFPCKSRLCFFPVS